MFNVFLGLLLILIPFLLTFCFTNSRRGFLYILSAVISFHLLIALITQSLHLFTYQLILGINIFISLVCVFIFIKYKKNNSEKIKINWLAILAFLIIFFELWSVHYFYSGQVGTIDGSQKVERASYSYPYFSDEWVGVSLVNYSLDNHTLSSGNSLTTASGYNYFSNILICWFALISELFLLLSLSPLVGYPLFALAAGLILCLLVYLTLRNLGLKNFSSVLGALCIPLITNSQNLPGTWYFLPFIGGLILFLISLNALLINNWKLFLISSAIALLIYPPLIVFILPTILSAILFNKQTTAAIKLKLIALGLFIFSSAAFAIILLQKDNLRNIINLAKSFLVYRGLDNGIASFAIWNIVPIFTLPFIIVGVIALFYKKLFFILIPIATGLILWIIYSQSLYFFIISYERTVVITSFLLIIAGGFGLEKIIEEITKRFPIFSEKQIKLVIKISCLLIFSFLAWHYTERNNWSKLILTIKTDYGEEHLVPMPPASEYLIEDDLNLFKSITKISFLSIPWKALAVGAATTNYPLDSKPSFITNRELDYQLFVRGDCATKKILANKYKIDYIYSPAFNCPEFSEEGMSRESLSLYKFIP